MDGVPLESLESAAHDALERLLAQCEECSLALHAWARLRLRALGIATLQPEDVVQETLFRALAAAASRPAPDGDARAWLFAIAKNVVFEEARDNRRTRTAWHSTVSASSLLERCADTVTSICTRLSASEVVEHFHRFAEGLDDVDRALLVRCGFEGRSATDVGRQLSLAPNTALKRWQRLRTALAREDCARKLGLIDSNG